MATYNRAHLILESLDSILKQSYKNWECLIIDDGSKDETETIVKSFIKKDSRFRYFKRPESHLKGLPGCRNYGLDLARGEYIIFFDDDDIVHPQNLEICLEILESTNKDFCHFRKKSFAKKPAQISEIKEPIQKIAIGAGEIESVVTNKIALASCTVMWQMKCFKEIRFLESLNYAEEWECYTRILIEGFRGIGINEVLYFNRKHPNSNTGEFWEGDKKRRESNEKAIKLVIENLQHKGLLSKKLIRYFVQMSIFLKNKSILDHVLSKSEIGFSLKLKYRLLYKFYPFIVLGHRTRKRLNKRH